MKQIIIIGLLTISISAFGQANTDSVSLEEKIFETAEKCPEYTGGAQAMLKFIEKNLKYPKKARSNGINGKVILGFIIEKDGQISPDNISVEQSVDPLLDEEGIRVVKLMPKWIPAENAGQVVRFKTRLPITFR